MNKIGYRVMAPPPIYVPEDTSVTAQWYTANGAVYDKKTGDTLPFDAIIYDKRDGAQVGEFSSTTGYFTTWTNDIENHWVEFKADGFANKRVSFADLIQAGDVQMVKPFPIWMLLLVGAAVYQFRKKTKKVGKLATSDIWPIFLIVAGVIGFSVVKDILEFLGLWKDKDTNDIEDAANDPNSFWNPNYWSTIKPADQQWTYAITHAQMKDWARELYDSFNWYNDCEECAIGIFKRMRTKANASFLCWVFNQDYGQDLITWLRGGNWPQDRLSVRDLNIINQYISKLPNY